MTIPQAIRKIERKLGFVVVGYGPRVKAPDIGHFLYKFGQYPLRRGELQIIAKGDRKDWENQHGLFASEPLRPVKRGEQFFRCRYFDHLASIEMQLAALSRKTTAAKKGK